MLATAFLLLVTACDKVPLLAPTGSVITFPRREQRAAERDHGNRRHRHRKREWRRLRQRQPRRLPDHANNAGRRADADPDGNHYYYDACPGGNTVQNAR